jgi:hypothetical protein
MSVCWYCCDRCEKSFNDCQYYVLCNDVDCPKRWCSDICAEEDGFNEEKSCYFCRLEYLEDSILVEFLLSELKISREEAIKRWHQKNSKISS